MLLISVPLFLIIQVIPYGFGGGDIKMMFAAGFFLGAKAIVIAFFIGIVSGAVYAVFLLLTKRRKKTEHFALGPFLSVGVAVSVYADIGIRLVDSYLYYILHSMRRRRINRYKNIIVTLICAISLAPAAFSMYLLYQVAGLEDQVEQLAGQHRAQQAHYLTAVKETQNQEVKASGEKEEVSEQTTEESKEQDTVEAGKRVYLTFDDGPSANLDEILSILKKEKVKATFFVVGKTDEQSMEGYRKIVKQGHQIGIHSYTHEYKTIYASLEAFQEDVTKMSDLIYEATGVRTKLYRFPGGSSNTVSKTPIKELADWLSEEGYIYYDWNALNGDAVTKDLSVQTLIDNIMGSVERNTKNKKNSTVLMHDLVNKHNTVESLTPLIEQLKSKGYVMDKALDETVPPVQQKKFK